MNEAKAQLNNYRQSPRKVRLVLNTVRGKKIDQAITILSFIPKRASSPIQKLLVSALANAKNLSMSTENLIVKEIKVDAGATLYRRRSRSKGMANPIRKRTSRISVTLTDNPPARTTVQSGGRPTTNKKSKKVVGNKLSVVS